MRGLKSQICPSMEAQPIKLSHVKTSDKYWPRGELKGKKSDQREDDYEGEARAY